jgi:hypothetical protein
MKFTTQLELHSQTTRLVEGALHGRAPATQDGVLTLCDALFQGTCAAAAPKASSANYNSDPPREPDFKFELLPLHSPLLGQSLLVSFPPLIDMLKFSGYSYLIRGQPKRFASDSLPIRPAPPGPPERTVTKNSHSLGHPRRDAATAFRACRRPEATARGPNTQAALEGCNDARTGMPPGIPEGAMCVQRFDDSRNSAIHTTYRISLRSSSMPEPRDPLLKVLTIQYHSDGPSLIRGSMCPLAGAGPGRAPCS